MGQRGIVLLALLAFAVGVGLAGEGDGTGGDPAGADSAADSLPGAPASPDKAPAIVNAARR